MRALISAALLLPAALAGTGCPSGDEPSPDPTTIDDEDLFAVDDDDVASGDALTPPGTFAITCTESEPNDPPVLAGSLIVPPPPWTDASVCGTVDAAAGGLVRIDGRIRDIVEGGWDGDKDGYAFDVAQTVRPRGVLQWEPLQGDLDAQVYCARGDAAPSRVFGSGLAGPDAPEQADAEEPIEAGSSCWVFVAGFAGQVADYTLWLEAIAD